MTGALCPSSTCREGHLLLGIVGPDGTVVGLFPPLEVDRGFVETATAGRRPPESRFRFAGPCAESSCGHWDGARCRVGDALTAAAPRLAEPVPPPRCAIRASCRWWSQNGALACASCSCVVHTVHTP
ncbi:hypothetical protein ACFQE5_07655 [Pseudonocardia hispaniensis]|uniref:Uncharacterized protein n=1 Tax=Pseudonocardia hispaniensis TaxID=904933 RepID=A0ABW1J166_9PSEU